MPADLALWAGVPLVTGIALPGCTWCDQMMWSLLARGVSIEINRSEGGCLAVGQGLGNGSLVAGFLPGGTSE